LSYLANTQTDKQTYKVWQKHNLLGGGNYRKIRRPRTTAVHLYTALCNSNPWPLVFDF